MKVIALDISPQAMIGFSITKSYQEHNGCEIVSDDQLFSFYEKGYYRGSKLKKLNIILLSIYLLVFKSIKTIYLPYYGACSKGLGLFEIGSLICTLGKVKIIYFGDGLMQSGRSRVEMSELFHKLFFKLSKVLHVDVRSYFISETRFVNYDISSIQVPQSFVVQAFSDLNLSSDIRTELSQIDLFDKSSSMVLLVPLSNLAGQTNMLEESIVNFYRETVERALIKTKATHLLFLDHPLAPMASSNLIPFFENAYIVDTIFEILALSLITKNITFNVLVTSLGVSSSCRFFDLDMISIFNIYTDEELELLIPEERLSYMKKYESCG